MSDFDNLGVLGKPALPSFLKFWTCEKASSSSRDTDLRTEATEVFFHDGGSFSDRDSGQTEEAFDDPRVARCS
jgi:hypothetical protein